MNFTKFGLHIKILEGINSIGYENATPVQEKVIPHILAGNDIIASAQTGTGKTAAFLLPVIHKILTEKNDSPIQALIIVPTRELAIQIDQNVEGIAYFTGVSSIAVYGGNDGVSFANEQKALKNGIEMVICTPGRMLSHLNMGYVQISKLKYLILDEADRMLDMGFYHDIIKIISFLPKQRQNMLFSATMPPKIRELARKILDNPIDINVSLAKPPEKIDQQAYIIFESQKIPLIKYILKEKFFPSILIFCSTKQNVKSLTNELKKSGFSTGQIHSDLDQKERENVLLEFKNRKINILIATDILSRGIDIEDIDLIVNYDVPNDCEDYIHRIGRTARAENKGIAITLINQFEQSSFSNIETFLGNDITKMKIPEFLGEAPDYNPLKKKNSRKNFSKKTFRKKNQQSDSQKENPSLRKK